MGAEVADEPAAGGVVVDETSISERKFYDLTGGFVDEYVEGALR